MNRNLPVILESGRSFRQFMQQVNEAPVLTAEEEFDLACRYREENDLKAAHGLIYSHLRLVVATARDYLGYRLPLSDLVQEGTVGLMQAVKRFDPRRGARLATYAVWWIRASIHEFILRAHSLVRIATTQLKRKLFFKLRTANHSLAPLNGEEAQELADRFGTDAETILEVEGRLANAGVSLNQPILDGDGEMLEQLADQRPNQEELVIAQEEEGIRTALIEQGLDTLDGRERQIVEARILNEQPATLESLSQAMGVSRERVRQLEQRAMGKMRRFFLQHPKGCALLPQPA